jgi:hypothetical protein
MMTLNESCLAAGACTLFYSTKYPDAAKNCSKKTDAISTITMPKNITITKFTARVATTPDYDSPKAELAYAKKGHKGGDYYGKGGDYYGKGGDYYGKGGDYYGKGGYRK